MATLKADFNPVMVDTAAGGTTGTTTVTYEKRPSEGVRYRIDGGPWVKPTATRRPDSAADTDITGDFAISLTTGSLAEVVVVVVDRDPDPNAQLLASLTIPCLRRRPASSSLVTDGNLRFGGTWYSRRIVTGRTRTRIVMHGVSRTPPVLDADGYPSFANPVGAPTAPVSPTPATVNAFEVTPLLPGQLYFAALVVMDGFGNWQVVQDSFVTLRRRLIIALASLHIYADGDDGSGEAAFWHTIGVGDPANGGRTLESHHQVIDPLYAGEPGAHSGIYPVGLVHVGELSAVAPGEQNVFVRSRGTEFEGPFEANDHADSLGGLPRRGIVQLPVGSIDESSPIVFMLNCPQVNVQGDDFRYGVLTSVLATYAA